MRTQSQTLTTNAAALIFSRAHDEGKITDADIKRYMREISEEADTLEARLQMLRDASGFTNGHTKTTARTSTMKKTAVKTEEKPKRKMRLSPEQKASRQLQGRFLGLIRQIAASKRAHFSKVAKEKGREVAIKEMEKALNK